MKIWLGAYCIYKLLLWRNAMQLSRNTSNLLWLKSSKHIWYLQVLCDTDIYDHKYIYEVDLDYLDEFSFIFACKVSSKLVKFKFSLFYIHLLTAYLWGSEGKWTISYN